MIADIYAALREFMKWAMEGWVGKSLDVKAKQHRSTVPAGWYLVDRRGFKAFPEQQGSLSGRAL